MIAFPQTYSTVESLYCPSCGAESAADVLQTFAHCCGQPLLTRYSRGAGLMKEALLSRERSMWRYFERLPVYDPSAIVTLGEGMTPLLPLQRLGARLGFSSLWVKDESGNPTGSFKARGMSVAISRLKELGVEACILPTAGNAGGAAAAYCARAGIRCRVVMPDFTPRLNKEECLRYGAEVEEVAGLINDCAARVREINREGEYYDLSTMKEPFRLEGKKTMAFEIAEQGDWTLPDAVVYPAGGGTGLVAMWKGFGELVEMGWVRGPLPRMIAVQTEGCAPLVRAEQDPAGWKEGFSPRPSSATGLNVPYPFGLDLMRRTLRESGGRAVTVSEAELRAAGEEVARTEGMWWSPEGAATVAALPLLKRKGLVGQWERIVVLNTGSGYKY